jgi:hypothetical protein
MIYRPLTAELDSNHSSVRRFLGVLTTLDQ